MKKGQILEGIVDHVDFPNKGIVFAEDKTPVVVKNTIPGQRVRVLVNKKRKGRCEGRLLERLEPSPLQLGQSACRYDGICGGCNYQSLPYEKQLALKEAQVKKLLDEAILPENRIYEYWGIKESPRKNEYRNKMEFSFGDEYKDGPLALGMHRRNSFYDVVSVPECQIVDEDFRTILRVTLAYFQDKKMPFYHKQRHTGYLRHLLVRKAVKTGDILVDLVTTTQWCGTGQEGEGNQYAVGDERQILQGWCDILSAQRYDGSLTGVLHTRNDSVADAVCDQGTDILQGQAYFFEELLGLRFKITPFSFFQTNSLGAEVLYDTVRQFIGDDLTDQNVVYDLYSGTGTIAQMLASVAKKVVGVEIVAEAVEAAKENAVLNGLRNCEFICGDVLKAIDALSDRPDYIVLDPPRDGIHPKALGKIIQFQVPRMIYISCKPSSLARDLEALQAGGYVVEKMCMVDMFPGTVHTECVVGMQRKHI